MPVEQSVDLGGGVKLELVLVPAGRFRMGSPAKEAGRSDNEKQHWVMIGRPFYLGKYEVTQEQWEKVMGERRGGFETRPYNPKNPVGEKKPNAWGLHDLHGNVWEWCGDWYGEYGGGWAPQRDPEGPVAGSARVLRGSAWNYNPGNCRSANRRGGDPTNRGNSVGFRVVAVPVPVSAVPSNAGVRRPACRPPECATKGPGGMSCAAPGAIPAGPNRAVPAAGR